MYYCTIIARILLYILALVECDHLHSVALLVRATTFNMIC